MKPIRIITAVMLLTTTCLSISYASVGLRIKCEPEGAQILLNGKNYGVCPRNVVLPRDGNWTLELRKEIGDGSFDQYTENLSLVEGEIRKIDATMQRTFPEEFFMQQGQYDELLKRFPNGKFAAQIRFKSSVREIEASMVNIPGGCFQMGDSFGDGDIYEKPVHDVCLTGFSMGKYEVTLGQFRAFVEDTGYKSDAEKNAGDISGCWTQVHDKKGNWSGSYHSWANWRKPLEPEYHDPKNNQPVSCVSWNDANAFIKWITGKSGRNYRLPTEAEWEYAARGATTTRNYWGNDSYDVCNYANTADQSFLPGGSNWLDKHECNDGYAFIAPVGQFKPNRYGLYDMLGNVWEWTADRYRRDYYAQSPKNNPKGPPTGDYRVIRGGGWYDDPVLVRVSNRYGHLPTYRFSDLGFRLVAPVQ